MIHFRSTSMIAGALLLVVTASMPAQTSQSQTGCIAARSRFAEAQQPYREAKSIYTRAESAYQGCMKKTPKALSGAVCGPLNEARQMASINLGNKGSAVAQANRDIDSMCGTGDVGGDRSVTPKSTDRREEVAWPEAAASKAGSHQSSASYTLADLSDTLISWGVSATDYNSYRRDQSRAELRRSVEGASINISGLSVDSRKISVVSGRAQITEEYRDLDSMPEGYVSKTQVRSATAMTTDGGECTMQEVPWANMNSKFWLPYLRVSIRDSGTRMATELSGDERLDITGKVASAGITSIGGRCTVTIAVDATSWNLTSRRAARDAAAAMTADAAKLRTPLEQVQKLAKEAGDPDEIWKQFESKIGSYGPSIDKNMAWGAELRSLPDKLVASAEANARAQEFAKGTSDNLALSFANDVLAKRISRAIWLAKVDVPKLSRLWGSPYGICGGLGSSSKTIERTLPDLVKSDAFRSPGQEPDWVLGCNIEAIAQTDEQRRYASANTHHRYYLNVRDALQESIKSLETFTLPADLKARAIADLQTELGRYKALIR